MDLFEQKHIAPMLLHQTQPFDSDDYVFELKFDGVRCIAYLDPEKGEVTLENKRFRDVSALFPELSEMFRCITSHVVLDGELVVFVNGMPDFFALQRRTLLGDSFRIARAAGTCPVQFVAFDILYLDGKDLTNLPLMLRKKMLKQNVKEGNGLAISRYIERNGVAFFSLVKAKNLEGIVAKRKDGLYHIGKRTRDWLKIKVMQDEELLICGYHPDENGAVKDLVLCERVDEVCAESGVQREFRAKNGALVCRGKVYLGISREERKIIESFAAKNPAGKPIFPQYKNVVWMKPQLVGTVEYMHKTANGSLRQPVWKGLRADV